jgi:hypothetical protein
MNIGSWSGFANSSFIPLQADAVLHGAAIGEDRGRGQIAGAIIGDEGDDTRNLLRARHPPQRYRHF